MSQDSEWLGQAVEWLVGHGDVASVQKRLSDLRSRREGAVQAPEDEDRVAWYLQFAYTYINFPTSLDYFQAARVVPVLAAIGRDVHLLQSAKNVRDRVAKWLSYGERRTPDSLLFELLIAGLYRRNGWDVEFLREEMGRKTPEMRVHKNGKSLLIECKRLTMHSDAYRSESLLWRKMWMPLRDELFRLRSPMILDIEFKRPMAEYGPSFLLKAVAPKLRLVVVDGVILDDDNLRVSVASTDMRRIQRELRSNSVKIGTSREIELITGRYEKSLRFSSGILGEPVTVGDPHLGPSDYWNNIEFAAGAYWHCTADESIARRARDIRSLLARAERQLASSEASCIHVGLETLDAIDVEELRFDRILATVDQFVPDSANLEWIYCHFLGPEAPPDKAWDFGESVLWSQRSQNATPLQHMLLVAPDDHDRNGHVHWTDNRKFPT